MTLKEILYDINLRMPNSFDESDLISFINKVRRDIYRQTSKAEAFTFETVKGLDTYPLPEYIKPELVKSVTVDGREYLPKRTNEAAEYNIFYFLPNGYMNIFPAPARTGREIIIMFENKAGDFLTLDEVEELNPEMSREEIQSEYEGQGADMYEEHLELLSLGVFVIAASAKEDIAAANNYKAEYNALLRRAGQEKYNKTGKYPQVRNVYRNTSAARRFVLAKNRRY